MTDRAIDSGDSADSSDSSAPADTGDSADSADPALPFSGTATVIDNPDNPFSALVHVTLTVPATVQIHYGEGGLDHVTTAVHMPGGQPADLAVSGLHAGRTFTLQAVASSDDAAEPWTSQTLTYTTAPIPANFPLCTPIFTAPESEYDADEVVCSNFQSSDGSHLYACFDRWGAPVLSARTGADDSLRSLDRQSDGGWVATGFTASKVLWLDNANRETLELSSSWFADRTRFPHDLVDPHELIELREGEWAGAVVFGTNTSETLADGGFVIGNGLIVYDRLNDEVLYDYSLVGNIHDGVSNDPKVPYTRAGTGDFPGDWSHENAILYGQDADGRPFFLLALKAQDWIIKLYPDTDEIAWAVGFDSDFSLVDDLDSASPVPLSDLDWPFHAHGMSWVEHSGSRLKLLMFDNGWPRHDGDTIEWDLEYSRVVELDIDEDTHLASTPFVYAPESDTLFSRAGGNAALLPDGARALFLVSEAQSAREISYPGGEERWRLTCDYHGEQMYRIRWYASL